MYSLVSYRTELAIAIHIAGVNVIEVYLGNRNFLFMFDYHNTARIHEGETPQTD